ncbi:AraC-like DNA-binding protein [Paenibacillus cellulosilyticus]|uniref:AraC-like DNA-binding protein n=1 Tax=Paenibacillus cellulosilyticus TaxID=375489 RepID=A0A2V2YN42_9BACL|nr:AraC family transcriptional regulator [Paenibacillus cellulosilyticus]PWV95894.1 AraC-like DNA-binding protein [Paenibacillus cellulosilyticus]QKS47762.1 helix-turn-helix domain-containing protein [Paenibacillus cellulosilyticus]
MRTAELVQRAIDFIEERLDEPLTLEQIAEASALSVPHLYRMFYAMTGHPIKEYIRKRRTNEAGCLLRQTDMAVIDVGFQCGFDSYQTFLKAFKRTTGLTPGMYRQSEMIYSFERIRLNERVAYLEQRDVSERYPDVSVIRLSAEQGIGFLYSAEQEEGIEEAALETFRIRLVKAGFEAGRLRIFGWNVDSEEQGFGYQLIAVSDGGTRHAVEEAERERLELAPMNLPGGLYAMTRTPYGSAQTIVAAWNRLLSEWLPRSTFALGGHGMLEEYVQLNGNIARMKLYLPVRRSQETDHIEVVWRHPIRVASFRAVGSDRVKQADEASIEWLRRSGADSNRNLLVYMTGSCEAIAEEEAYEVCFAPTDVWDNLPLRKGDPQIKELAGGLYACLKCEAYGFMTGVLERIYRWLGASVNYELDVERDWYASYGNGYASDGSIIAVCYVPVQSTQAKSEA